MFLLDNGQVVASASDLTAASACEFAVLRQLDAILGRVPGLEPAPDAMLERVAALGDQHEQAVLKGYVGEFGLYPNPGGGGVASVARPRAGAYRDGEALHAAHATTLKFLDSGADVVYQAGFFDGDFVGWADFLIRDGDAWQVQDTKLARSEKVTALLQLAAYAQQLAKTGRKVADRVALILGSGAVSEFRTIDLVPVFEHRMTRLRTLVDERVAADGPLGWGTDGVKACLRCEACMPFVEQARDVLLVAGLTVTQRAKFAAVGIHTVEELATSSGPVDAIGVATLDNLRRQARLQEAQDAANAGRGDDDPLVVKWEIVDPAVLGTLPAPDPGDIFFDFEGDPLWTDDTLGSDGQAVWGLEYLFGVIEAPVGDGEPVFRPFWAHDRAEEKQAMVEFMAYLLDRRATHPGMHVYHYAPYERSALLRLAGRHGVFEDELDQLLRDGVLIDLYATVRASLRTGERAYSLKNVEHVYGMAHVGDVKKADQSIVEYANACELRDTGDQAGWQAKLDQIGDYNRTDCISTLELRDWLLARGAELGVPPRSVLATGTQAEAQSEGADEGPIIDPLGIPLMTSADPPDAPPGPRTPQRQAAAMLAAALGYHKREAKPFWWAHYDRLSADPAEWTDKRGTFVADEVEVLEDWGVRGKDRSQKRLLKMVGQLLPGSDMREGKKAFPIYDPPLPADAETSSTGFRGWRKTAEIREVTASADGRDVLVVQEGGTSISAIGPTELPMGLGPAHEISDTPLAAAIRALALQVADNLPDLPDCAAIDLLLRRPPRTRSGNGLTRPVDAEHLGEAIFATMRDLDGSYVAVQGPPGTGKTYLGARVVKALVEQGWKVGIVAQSHAVVENFLQGAVDAGLDGTRIGKKPGPTTAGSATPTPAWTTLGTDFAGFFAAQAGGFLVGGTAWDFTNAKRIPTGGYNLLVVDEAGQFALANTLAVSGAAANLLLLGDPQQLPQVSQGTHPEPVEQSALGWLSTGHDTLPDELGYFLPESWRMHPDLCQAVSALSYEGRLTAAPTAAARCLDGIDPGVIGVPVLHSGNTVMSREEADELVAQVAGIVGRQWHDEDGTRLMAPADVLVVAAYNAQVWEIRHALDAAGYADTKVGTVDRFQGRQAPVVIVSMAASSPEDVPRGMEFLLDRNRLNVAISRGKWCARIIHSPALTDYLPSQPDHLENLGAFIRLCGKRGALEDEGSLC